MRRALPSHALSAMLAMALFSGVSYGGTINCSITPEFAIVADGESIELSAQCDQPLKTVNWKVNGSTVTGDVDIAQEDVSNLACTATNPATGICPPAIKFTTPFKTGTINQFTVTIFGTGLGQTPDTTTEVSVHSAKIVAKPTGSVAASQSSSGDLTQPINGACGSANNQAAQNMPTSGLCSQGRATLQISGGTFYSWECTSLNGGTDASCGAPRGYTVTASVSGVGGVIASGASQSVSTGGYGVVTADPDPNYTSVFQSTCGGSATGDTFTTGPVNANCQVTVSFSDAPVYATCGTASTNSSLRFSTAPVNSAQNYTLCGTGTAGSVTTSSTQYSWSCTGSIGDSTSDDVSCNVSRYYTVTATASGGNGSIASGSDSQQVAGGQSATITAQPATGYAPLFTTSCSGAQSGNSYTINSVTSNCSVSVTFAVSQSPSSDPGSGLWLPTSSTTRVIADQSGSAKLTSYVPGCLNGEYPTNGSSSGCAIKSSYTGIPAGLTSTTTVTMGAGNILGIRYTTNPSVTTTYKSIKVDGYDGGNVGNSMKVWLSSSPTAEYAATATGCKITSTTHPTIYSGPMAGDCLLSPNTRYYLFLQISDACTNCRFQIYEGGSDFLK